MIGPKMENGRREAAPASVPLRSVPRDTVGFRVAGQNIDSE